MIISFFGHSNFQKHLELSEKLLNIFEENVNREDVSFYLGGYGAFDEFARIIAKQFQKEHKNSILFFVSPCLNERYIEMHKEGYDEILYPEIEKVPHRYAISARNKWMVDKADIIIVFIAHNWGGAFSAYMYAKAKMKRIIELSE